MLQQRSIVRGLSFAGRVAAASAVAIAFASWSAPAAAQTVTKYARYSVAGAISYGILDGETVRELSGDLFADPRATGRTWRLAEVTLLAPLTPRKVIAVGLNYRSHLGTRAPATEPGLFAKYPTSMAVWVHA